MPLPKTFMDLVRRVGVAHNLLKSSAFTDEGETAGAWQAPPETIWAFGPDEHTDIGHHKGIGAVEIVFDAAVHHVQNRTAGRAAVNLDRHIITVSGVVDVKSDGL